MGEKTVNFKVKLPCNCHMIWNEDNGEFLLCRRHEKEYRKSLGITDDEFIKRIANPRGSRLSNDLASSLR